MAVTGQQVADFLGQGTDTTLVALAGQHATIITAMARSYTRDQGFTGSEPADDIAAVITTATARLVANPEQIPTDIGSVSLRGGFTGWTLAELFVLNRYRKRAS
ncbi:hypothetical protein [Mycolicibacterium mageritense]|uniref:hypothetical protein n=1 Tax=Mycolicibacterium mageritense TaxID=53462 RepID=UPI0011DBB841|nr:hypothetical protein [Mycolicibacterium mageritense]TXI61975.1 MAG: hypothetical protein E6Q55_14580 [Mycolicibacterium mageritense]